MRDFPGKEWFNKQKQNAHANGYRLNGLNLFAIWMRECGVRDEPCPPDVDPNIWEGFYSYLHAWMRLGEKDQKFWYENSDL